MSNSRTFSIQPLNFNSIFASNQPVAASGLVDIPFMPSVLSPRKLNTNLMLLTPEEIEKVENYAREEQLRSGDKIPKELLKTQFSVELHGEDFYAIYEGGEKSLGRGAFGRVKAAQKVTGPDAGQWYALKLNNIRSNVDQHLIRLKTEHDISMDLNQSPRVPSPEPSSSAATSPRPVPVNQKKSGSPRRLSSPATFDHLSSLDSPRLLSNEVRRIGSAGAMRRPSKKNLNQYPFIMNYGVGISLAELVDRESEWLYKEEMADKVIPFISVKLHFKIVLDLLEKMYDMVRNKRTLHRDLKLENIIVDIIDQSVTIIDYGNAAKILDGDCVVDKELLSTPMYVAPELCRKKKKELKGTIEEIEYIFDEKTEVYALGIILAQVFALFDFNLICQETDQIGSPQIDLKKICKVSGVVDKGDDYYDFNKIIDSVEQGETLSSLWQLIQNMTASDKDARYDLEQALHCMRDIYNSYQPSVGGEDVLFNQYVCLLDCKYYQMAGDEEKEIIKENLNQYDEVWLIDTNECSVSEYISIKNELENAGYFVGNKVGVASKPEKAAENIMRHLAQREIQSMGTLYSVPENTLRNNLK